MPLEVPARALSGRVVLGASRRSRWTPRCRSRPRRPRTAARSCSQPPPPGPRAASRCPPAASRQRGVARSAACPCPISWPVRYGAADRLAQRVREALPVGQHDQPHMRNRRQAHWLRFAAARRAGGVAFGRRHRIRGRGLARSPGTSRRSSPTAADARFRTAAAAARSRARARCRVRAGEGVDGLPECAAPSSAPLAPAPSSIASSASDTRDRRRAGSSSPARSPAPGRSTPPGRSPRRASPPRGSRSSCARGAAGRGGEGRGFHRFSAQLV